MIVLLLLMDKMERTGYLHTCPFCGETWTGYKKDIVACTKCKARLDYPRKVPGKHTALQYIEQSLLRSGYSMSRARKEATIRLREATNVRMPHLGNIKTLGEIRKK